MKATNTKLDLSFAANHQEAAQEMLSGPYSSWGDPERTVINVDAFYREFAGDSSPANRVELFGIMAKIV